MIRRVWSSLEDFREARFAATGLSIVLANRGEDSDDTESTNGLGKSTLLRIIHFVLGAELKRTSILAHDELAGVTFGLDVEIDGVVYSLCRCTTAADVVLVDVELIKRLPLDVDLSNGQAKLSLETWRTALSMLFTPETRRDGAEEIFSPRGVGRRPDGLVG